MARGRRAIKRVLAGYASYDDLRPREQAVVRAAWDKRIAASIAALDYEAEFRAAGKPWAEADDQGNLIIRGGAHERPGTDD